MWFNLLEAQHIDRTLTIFTRDCRVVQNAGKQLTVNNFRINIRFFFCGGMCLARAGVRGEVPMKKNEFSELTSNLLIVGSVSLAFMPFLLGDRLIPFVSGLLQEGSVIFDQFSNYLVSLVS